MAFGSFNKPLDLRRSAGGEYVNGVWTPAAVWADVAHWDDALIWGDDLPITIQASVQPASENELKLLPEGRREEGAYAIRTTTEILAGDIVPIGGYAHEVIKRQIWQNGVLPHYLGVAVRMQP